MKLSVEIKFEPRDLWIGAFFDDKREKLYICVLPCFPLILTALDPASDDPKGGDGRSK